MVAQWRGEFAPSYDVPDAVTNEPGLIDISYRNDVAPSFTWDANAEGFDDVRLWVDHPDAEMREVPGATRFTVIRDSDTLLIETDNVVDALIVMRAARKAAR